MSVGWSPAPPCGHRASSSLPILVAPTVSPVLDWNVNRRNWKPTTRFGLFIKWAIMDANGIVSGRNYDSLAWIIAQFLISRTFSGWPHGDGLLVAGLFFTDYPPSWEKIPLLRTRGYVILWENRGGSVGSVFDSRPMCCWLESHPRNWTFRLSPQCSTTG